MASEEVKGLGWGLAAKACDSCKAASALLFCRADSAFLCISCDAKIHGANKLASRHERVWICEVCEQAPAAVTCKADAAALCVTCDRDIHSANPLARRHDRLPVVPFFDSPAVKLGNINHSLLVPDDNSAAASAAAASQFDAEDDDDEEEEEEEDAAEAESWLLSSDPPSHAKLINNNEIGNNQNHHHHHHHQHQHQNLMNIKSNGEVDHYLFSDVVDPYLDLDYGPRFQFPNHHGTADSVVPVVNHPNHHRHGHQSDLSSDHITPVFINPANSDHNHNSLDMDFYRSSSKPTSFSYTTAPSLSQSLVVLTRRWSGAGRDQFGLGDIESVRQGIKTTTATSSTTNPPINPTTNHHMEFGVVAAAAANNSNSSTTQQLQQQQQLCGVDREARVLRYREKRKNRKFEKTIRYASRKAYAETRPRIKGRFAKRTEIEADVDRIYSSDATIIDVAGYGIVPSF
ncbi:hypothetical protein Syun_024969 [Stephania yunnanensis]|uniref:Uncharacterized protein n=1 Tax=Stephania yunnanensis TaxID=152371 RepID=A0AAP0ER82_9MAGN